MGTPATISQVGAMVPFNNNSGFLTSMSLNPTNVGDIVVAVVELKYSAASNRTITGISGTGIAWKTSATFRRFMADGIHAVEYWYGTVTATGTNTHTISYSSTTGQTAGSSNVHELTSTAGASTAWSVDTLAGTNFNDPNTNNTTFTYPSLTSALDKECYIGYLAITGSASTGGGTGWVYENDLRGNWDAHNVNVGVAGTVASTTQTSGSSQLWFTVGVLFSAQTATTAHPLTASGLAASAGTASLNDTEPLLATGQAASAGSAALNDPQILTAAGQAASKGSASLGFPQPLTATGAAVSGGGASLLVRDVLAAAGQASSGGTALMLSGKVQNPFAVVASELRPNILDCGVWRVFIATRGGGNLLAELDYETLSLGRKLNDVSVCTVTVLAAKNAACLPVLGQLEPFQHEIVAFRNYQPGDPPAWAGPVVLPAWDPLSLVIGARDLFTWMDKRTLPFDRNFVSTDLADIFGGYLQDALVQDASPNITPMFLGEIGTSGARAVTAVGSTLAGDALRELSRSGVDFSLVGRTMRYGGKAPNVPATILYDPAIYQDPNGSTPKLTKQGLNMATRVTVKGGQDFAGNQITSTVGFPDSLHGLISQVVSEPLILDTLSATHAGADRLAFLNPAPRYLSCVLTSQAPVRFDKLLPGIRIDTAFSCGLTTVQGPFRLQAVDVTYSQAGEVVALTLVPLVV